MRGVGFHHRLFGAAFLVICMTTLILDVVGVRVTREFMLKRFNDRIDFLARYLALNSEVGLLMGDGEKLKTLALNLLNEEDVAEVAVYDGKGNKLADEARKVAGPLSVIIKPVLFKMEEDESLLFQGMKPLPESTGRNNEGMIGEIKISYSTYGVEQLIRKMTIRFGFFSVGLSILSGLVFYFVSHPMVKEVKELALAARQVGKGDIELRVRPGKIPETRSLAMDFNSMLDSLNQSREAFDRVSREMIKQKSLAEVGKFSMMIAHEVKNPLSIIKGSLDILKKDQGLTSDDLMVAYMEDEIRRLNRLIEDFLSFARPIKPVFYEVDLNEMAKTLVSRFQMVTGDNDVTFRDEIPDDQVVSFADRDLLLKALGNIVKNACEAVGAKGEVRIFSRVIDASWLIDIEDTGGGIDPEHLNRLFEPFFTTRATGTGLGLAFTQQVVDTHQGTVSAGNAESGGAVFTVKIPIAADSVMGPWI